MVSSKKVILMGCSSCPFYVAALEAINANPNYTLFAHYRHPDMGVYKNKLRRIQSKSDQWTYLSDAVKRKFKKMRTSPVVIIPEDDFVGGYDDVLLFFGSEKCEPAPS